MLVFLYGSRSVKQLIFLTHPLCSASLCVFVLLFRDQCAYFSESAVLTSVFDMKWNETAFLFFLKSSYIGVKHTYKISTFIFRKDFMFSTLESAVFCYTLGTYSLSIIGLSQAMLLLLTQKSWHHMELTVICHKVCLLICSCPVFLLWYYWWWFPVWFGCVIFFSTFLICRTTQQINWSHKSFIQLPLCYFSLCLGVIW